MTQATPTIVCLIAISVVVFFASPTAAYHGGANDDLWSNVASLPAAEVNDLLLVHNEGRAAVEPTASNMNRVQWSHELYAAAKERVESCQYIIDIPRETGHFGNVVQFTGISKRGDFDLTDAVDTWMAIGKESYNFEDDSCSKSEIFCRMYKLFTWGPMESIGCSSVLCGELNDTYSNRILPNTFYWKCNYYPVGNLDDPNPYSAGTPCIDCPDQADGSGWCNADLNMCDSTCTPSDASCDCLYSDTCTGVYDYDPTACTCTCNHPDCADDPFVCILNCGNADWAEVDHDAGVCRCNCPSGYETNAAQDICTDIDECLDVGRCDHFCDNTPGSYICSCMFGFELLPDGRTCLPAFMIGRHDFLPTTPATPTPTPEITSTEVSTTEVTTPEVTTEVTTPEVTTECPELACGDYGTYNPETCSCDCQAGFEIAGNRQPCVDVNECETNKTGCDICVNTVGSFHCITCPVGHQLNNRTGLCEEDVCNLGEGMFCSENGFLDEDHCECVCYSGYEGPSCEYVCYPADTSCWPPFEPIVPTEPFQCVAACPEFECSDYPPCSNNGTRARARGYQHIREDVCFCFCALPWSGELCDECNLECQNGGTLDEVNCSCSCPAGWFGGDCSQPCVETSRLCTNQTASYCGKIAIIDEHCPITCALCQAEQQLSGVE